MPATSCDLFQLKDMPNGSTCRDQWTNVRTILRPSQQAIGYAAVKRKCHKDYKTPETAQERMDQPVSLLPFVLGPGQVPFLVDSHHTASALEASGFDSVRVTMKKICDWSHLSPEVFFEEMRRHNFMNPIGRPTTAQDDVNALAVPVDVVRAIPPRIGDLRDDPWRSLAAMVRKVKSPRHCRPDHHDDACLRGYVRECRPDGGLTPFFEFRWAYFLNDAYSRGCEAPASYWDDPSDCRNFERAYRKLLAKNTCGTDENGTCPNSFTESILEQDHRAWQKAAKLLIPLCRGRAAQTYVLPSSLGSPMGGEHLPGCVAGRYTPITEKDPVCAAPQCPVLPPPPVGMEVPATVCNAK